MHSRLRMSWIEDTQSPLRSMVVENVMRRRAYGIGAMLGIEAFVWLTDIAGPSQNESIVILRSNALGLLQVAIDENTTTL